MNLGEDIAHWEYAPASRASVVELNGRKTALSMVVYKGLAWGNRRLKLREQIAGYPRWKVADDVLLGTFAFQKVAMWKDLDANRESIAGHSICKALAGEIDQPITFMDCLQP